MTLKGVCPFSTGVIIALPSVSLPVSFAKSESFSILELAEKVSNAATNLGLNVKIQNIENPRTEQEDHYYNPVNKNLLDMGLSPINLSDGILEDMIKKITFEKDSINKDLILPKIKWKQ